MDDGDDALRMLLESTRGFVSATGDMSSVRAARARPAGFDPAEKIAIFRIPGSWEDEGFALLDEYGVEYVDRSVSMHEAAGRAVEKVGG